jgi:hypothetical protein
MEKTVEERLAALEAWTHPPVAPGGTTEIMDLINNLEKQIKELKEEKHDV